jgi:hypothetical protein
MLDRLRFERLWLFATLALFVVTPAFACETCVSGLRQILAGGGSWCEAVKEGETGVTICRDGVDSFGKPWCTESGTYCSVITVGGGGGGTSGGGGGSACQVSGFCPAECFNCSGGTPKT